MQSRETNIFLSYCWKDDSIADDIYNYIKEISTINIHRDKIDIGTWGSIKEYMQSITDMDYTILLISDSYLKSANCMYEVLEVIKDKKYKNKIFPAIIETNIYKPVERSKYVKYWQEEQKALKEELNGIEIQNIGNLNIDLKRIQDIASNIAVFLEVIADMNNPHLSDINIAIKNKLIEEGILPKEQKYIEVAIIIEDLNKYYIELKNIGLEDFFKNKYLSKMNQGYKNELFKTLWNYTFINIGEQYDKNRQAYYWILHYLYNQNKEHYKSIIKDNEEHYLNKLSIETFKVGKVGELYQQIGKYSNSRMMTLINFIEDNNDIYTIFNEYGKSIVNTMVNHAFLRDDIETIKLYEIGANEQNDMLFRQQLILKAKAVFLVDDMEWYFRSIKSMVSNYCATAEKWFEPFNYSVLGESVLDKIFKQVAYRGVERQFITFLISYCMNAANYRQADYMIKYIEPYIKYFTEEDFYFALTKMSENSQYTDNDNKIALRKVLEDNYKKVFNRSMLEIEEEKYLYPKLYNLDLSEVKDKHDEILNLIEKRAKNYSVWNLWHNILKPLIEGMKKLDKVFSGNIDNYKNILEVLARDEHYGSRYTEALKKVFMN